MELNNLVVAKPRITLRDLSIPRLEVIAAHMPSKLMDHVKVLSQRHPNEEYHCWVDSTTVLYLMKGQRTWTQFMRNRTQTIQDKRHLDGVTCLQVKTLANKEAEVQNPEI